MKYIAIILLICSIGILTGCSTLQNSSENNIRTLVLPSGIESGSGKITDIILYTNITFTDNPIPRSMRSHQGIIIGPWIDTFPEMEYFWSAFYQLIKYKNQLPNISLNQNSSVEDIKIAVFANRETSSGSTCMNISHSMSLSGIGDSSQIIFGIQSVDLEKNSPLDLPLVARWNEQFSGVSESLLSKDTNIPASIDKGSFLFEGILENKVLYTNIQKEFSIEYQECDIQNIEEIIIPMNMKNRGIGQYQFYIHNKNITGINMPGIEKLMTNTENEYIEKQKLYPTTLICFSTENECSILIDSKKYTRDTLSIKLMTHK